MSNPWFRMYAEFATDPKVQSMSEAMQRRFMMLLCLRCSNSLVTLQHDEIAFALRVTEEELAETKALFERKGFIDGAWNIVHWDKRQFVSDSSAERVRKHRKAKAEAAKQACNVTVTPPDTDTDTDKELDRDKRADERDDPIDAANHSSEPRLVATEAARACQLMRKAGCLRTNPGHAVLVQLIGNGYTADQLADIAAEYSAEIDGEGLFAYALKVAKTRLKPKPVTQGSAHANHPAGRSGGSKLSAVERVEAAIAIRKQAEASAEAQPAAQGLTADDRRLLGSDGHDVRA